MTEERRARKRKADKERWYWLRDHGICPVCAAADIEPGLWGCKLCVKKSQERKRQYDPDGSKQYEKNKQRREQRMALGLCISCGKPAYGYKNCEACRAKNRDRCRVYLIKRKMREEVDKAKGRTV